MGRYLPPYENGLMTPHIESIFSQEAHMNMSDSGNGVYPKKKYHNEHGPPQNRENWWLSTFQANFSNKPILFMASHTLRADTLRADTLRACTSWSISFAPVGTSGGQSRHQPTSQVVGRSKKGTRNGWDMMISPIWKEKAAKEPLIVFFKNGTYSFWEVEARVKTGNCSSYNMLWSIWKAVSIGESLFAIPNMDSLVNQTPFTVPSSFVKQLQKMILAIFFGDLSNPNCKSKGFKGRSKYPNWLTKKTVFWGDFLGLKSVTTPVLFGDSCRSR